MKPGTQGQGGDGIFFQPADRIQCLSAMQNGKTVYGELGHNMKWIFRRTGASGFGFCHVFTVVYMKIRVGVLGHGRNDSSEYDGAHNKKGQDLHEDIDDGKSVFPVVYLARNQRYTHPTGAMSPSHFQMPTCHPSFLSMKMSIAQRMR